MDSTKRVWTGIAAVLIAALVGFGGYTFGKSQAAESAKASAQAEYQAERELEIKLNRSELEGLGEIEGPIYVAGHKAPDADTVGSAIAYADLLNQLGYDATPVVLGEINKETKYYLEKGGIEVPQLLEDASGLNMVLVDHSEYAQSADGLEDANVLMIIDHHGDGSVTASNQVIYDNRPIGSTATIIWMRYRNYGLELDQKTAYALLGSVLSDTGNLHSSTTTTADREALKALAKIAGVEDVDALYTEMFKASLSYEGMSDEEIFFSDYKEYEAGGYKYGIGCVNAYDEEAAAALVARMKTAVPASTESTGVDYAYAQVSIYHDDIAIMYLVPSSEAAGDILETAFGDKGVFDGTSYRFEPSFSRKTVLVPAISDVLESHPKE